MHWSFCQQDENCIALNYRIVPFFGVGRWPYRYKDLQRKRELRRVRRKYIYIYKRRNSRCVTRLLLYHPFKLLQKLKALRDKGMEAENLEMMKKNITLTLR